MRIVRTLLLMAAAFGAGAALAGRVSHHDSSPLARPEAVPAPTEGQRDPKADLDGQMMWDPASRAYLGG